MALPDSDLYAGTLGQAAMSCCLQLMDVYESIGAADYGYKPKTLISIEPFDDCFNGSAAWEVLELG